MNLGDMTTQFTGLMNRRDLTANTALVDTFMSQGIMRVQRELRVPAMEKMADVTIVSPYTGLAIPSDMLELKEIRPAANNIKLKKTNLDQSLFLSQSGGIPCVYARQGSQWILGPSPATGDVIRITYYAELSPLVADTDENIVTTIAWDMIVYAALVQAAIYFKDSRAADWETQYQQILGDLQEQADADELGDNAAVMPGLYYPTEDEMCG